MMNRCSPTETRKNLDIAKSFADIGLDFVSIPVADSDDKQQLLRLMNNALNIIAMKAEEEEKESNNDN